MTSKTAYGKSLRRRRGFTLIEALVSTAIAAIAGSALLQGVYGSIGSTKAGQEQLIAAGLAQQMMDEIAGKMYSTTGDYATHHSTSLGPNASEQAGVGRSLYNDIDDYVNIGNSPPVDPWNVAVGADDGRGSTRHPSLQASSYMSNWRREVDVYYVSATDLQTKLTGSSVSDFRAVEVRIYVNDPNGAQRSLATLKRVFAYVPGS